LEQDSLQAFHAEFKSLVLESTASSEEAASDPFAEPFEPHELEWLSITESAAPRTSVAPTVAIKLALRQQVVRPMTGPPLGTPLPLETWVVKVIVVLIGLNLLFAGLIVSGVRLSDLFK
jgi:hypothetical protein